MNTNTIRRIAHETGMFGPEFNVTGEQCDKFASALISATVDSVARTWDECMVPMFDPAGNLTGVIDIGATIRADGVLSAAGLVDSLPDMQGEPVDRLANLQCGAAGAMAVQEPRYLCNKCGYSGPVQVGHQRPNGTGECGYIAVRVREVAAGVVGIDVETFCTDTPTGESKAKD